MENIDNNVVEKKEEIAGGSLELQKQWNQKLYADILPEHYDTSYGNPAYAGRMLGETYGSVLSAVYAEIRGAVVYAFEDRMWDITVLCELFLEIYLTGICIIISQITSWKLNR